MTEKTLTRANITSVMSQRLSLPRQKSNAVLETILSLMERAIVESGSLKLASFGSFSVRHKKERVGRNPKTGEEAMITPRKTISFKASHTFKEKVTQKD